MKDVVPLVKARETAIFGSKAVGLGDAEREGLRVPPGIALSGSIIEAVAAGDERAVARVAKAVRTLQVPLAVRSSAVDEDGTDASFAGQHLTLLNVPSARELPSALREIWWSANSDSAITYRQRVGLFTRPSVGVVVQTLLDPDVAGVMFTENPMTGRMSASSKPAGVWARSWSLVLSSRTTTGSTAPVRCSNASRDARPSPYAPSRLEARSRRRFRLT